MTNNYRAYLKTHLRNNLKPLLFIVVFSVVLTVALAYTNQKDVLNYYYNDKIRITYYCTIWIPVMILAISCYIAPYMEFAFFKKRRNLDCAYALPISRKEMGRAHYFSGLLTIFLPYTLSYITNTLLMLRYQQEYFFTPLIPHYFLCLLFGICTYSIFVFVFNEANSPGDGIWFIILWSAVFYLVLSAVRNDLFLEFLNKTTWRKITSNSDLAFVFSPLVFISEAFTDRVERPEWYTYTRLFKDDEVIFCLIFWLVVGIAATIAFFKTFGKRRMEKTEEISDSWFGYRILVPVYAVAGMLTFGSSGNGTIILEVIIVILALLGYAIYRRGFHYKKSEIIILSLLLIFLFI
ncbi:MAG: hypothetical protein IKU25_08100 [Clostridia bacterium]|nr:hypothetical protein [Clostridia bacterium]